MSTGPRQFCAAQPEAMWFWAAHLGHVPSPQFWEESAAWGGRGALYIWLGQPWLGWGSPLLPLRIHATCSSELDRVNQGRGALRFVCRNENLHKAICWKPGHVTHPPTSPVVTGILTVTRASLHSAVSWALSRGATLCTVWKDGSSFTTHFSK